MYSFFDNTLDKSTCTCTYAEYFKPLNLYMEKIIFSFLGHVTYLAYSLTIALTSIIKWLSL